MKRILVLLALCVALIAGCQEGEQSTEVEPQGRQYAIEALEGIIDSGQIGSEVGRVVEELEKLKASEPELAQKLIEESDGLLQAESPEQFKERAQAMLDQLKGGSGGGAEGGTETTEGE